MNDYPSLLHKIEQTSMEFIGVDSYDKQVYGYDDDLIEQRVLSIRKLPPQQLDRMNTFALLQGYSGRYDNDWEEPF